ncbi:MAG TPA: heterodisulfide reductase-related iron-sulfur binding cluster [Candidatus Deferrimicrobium sp.]|nr:heterodisulfide reductase-related iron-sulfur binding cluster [Candidatus Deferrimicrobium sp.]
MLLWIETIIFTAILIFTFYGFFNPLYLRYRLLKLGKPEKRFDNPFKRIMSAVGAFFFLNCSVKRERIFTGFMHFFFLYGSLTFDTVSINHILEGYKEGFNLFGHGTARLIYSAWVDVFGIMVLVGVLYFVIRRYILKPKSYTYPSLESVFIYLLLVTVTVTFFLYEGAVIAHNPAETYAAFAGKQMAAWMQAVMPMNMTAIKIFWWLHILNVFAFILYVPRSKYLHMIAGPINIAFHDCNSGRVIKTLNLEDENAQSFGVVKATDLTWKDLLDGLACIDCGRCEDYCPANQTEKPLSPKKLILKMKDELLAKGRALLKNPAPGNEMEPLMQRVYTDDEIWNCTSCGACMYVCPVKNEHLTKIFGLRQSQVLMEAKFPEELNLFFKNMETNSNPWGFGSSTRAEWAEGLDVKTLANRPDVDILYWVGCAGSFDEKGKKVSTAMVKILKEAGVNFGILGREENCCGDQVRRLGNEYLFQTMARANIETFKKYNVKKILVTCPHGYNTFKNEYPKFAGSIGVDDWNIDVVHHSEFIAGLIEKGNLKIKHEIKSAVTYHDPCYLGRHNEIYKAPRKILAETGITLLEMKNRCQHSLCCGAGGGLMWTEEKLGKKIYQARTEAALETGADLITVACPFCNTMLDDGVKDKGKEETVHVKDIAEIVAKCL